MLHAGDFRSAAWQKLSGTWITAVLTTLLYGVLMGALSPTVIGAILLCGPFWYGYAFFCLARIRWQKPELGILFSGLQKCFVNSIAVYLLTRIFTALWSLLLFVPGIIKSYSYAMAPYILADHPDMDALEVIDESRYLMDGCKWRLFCLDLSFIGWWFLTVITFGIAGLWYTPYRTCARAQFYETIKDKT